MTITWIWTGMVAVSFVYAIICGNTEALGIAVIDGAKAGVELCLELCGITCFWCGIMKVFERSGIMAKLTTILRPIVTKLLPSTRTNTEAVEFAAANISANLLGLGNAATPMGLKAISAMSDGSSTATDDMCTFTVLNSASIQLIPITVAAVRSTAGALSPFDIVPAVWITSVASAAVGIAASKLLAKKS